MKSNLKILLLPTNIASISANTVDGLNKMPNVEARGFYINKYPQQFLGSKKNTYFEGISRKKHPVKWFIKKIRRFFLFRKLINWADIIHWVYDDLGLSSREKRIIQNCGKPAVIEWVGSDIRDPKKLFQINRYYKHAFNNGYEYAHYESSEQSEKNQQKFYKYRAYPLVNPEMDLYVRKELFPKRFFVWPRLPVSCFNKSFPDPDKEKPLILHSPTAKIAKGSNFILSVIEDLKKDFEFDFVLLQGIPREEVLKLMQQCDIFIDQIILGMYGLASCEAMSFGKPVLCYIMQEVYENGLPSTCPIINSNPETLKEKLVELISDPFLRFSKGMESRQYAEAYFDVDKNSSHLVEIYTEIIKLSSTLKSSE